MSTSLPSTADSLFRYLSVPSQKDGTTLLVWAHGWGQSASAFRSLAEAMSPYAPSILLDFPGFGSAPLPPSNWGTHEYADAAQSWLHEVASGRQIIWIGHSFGGRVGIRLASRKPQPLSALVLIAAAGLQRKRSLAQRVRIGLRRTFFKAAKRVLSEGPQLDRLRQRMGSADYRNAGPLRPILSRVVAEDLSPLAGQISCPTLLLYGKNDAETPPEFGERFHKLIPGSELTLLDHLGHLDILTEGQHQVTLRLRRFLQQHQLIS